MRNVLGMILGVTLVVAFAGLTYAEDKIATAGNKLAEGIKDTAISPARVPQEMVQTGKEQNPLVGVTLGSVRGAEEASRQATEGAIRTGFFYVPSSEQKLAQAGQDLSIGDKLAQGVQNTAVGWTRIPVRLYQRGKENFLLLPVGVVEGSEQASLQTTEGVLQTGFFFTGPEKTQAQAEQHNTTPTRTSHSE